MNTDDNFDTEPSTQTLVSGTTIFQLNLRVAGLRKATSYAEADVYAVGYSTPIPIDVGAYAKLQLLVPGETAVPGKSDGKTGTPSTRTAGTPFMITVNTCDVAYNVKDIGVLYWLDIWTSDPNDAHSQDGVQDVALQYGTTYYPITMVTASLWSGTTYTVTVKDLDNGSIPTDTSPEVPTVLELL